MPPQGDGRNSAPADAWFAGETAGIGPGMLAALSVFSDPLFVLDRGARLLFGNRAFFKTVEAVLGYQPALDSSMLPFIRPEEERAWAPRIRRCLSGENVDVDLPVTLKDGTRRWYDTSLTPVYQGSTVQAVLGISRDITALRAAQEATRTESAALRRLVEGLPDAITIFQRDGTILDFKPGSGVPVPPGQIVGRSLYDFKHVDPVRIGQVLTAAFDTRQPQFFEYIALVGETRRVREARIVAIRENEALLIVRDVTEQRAAEQQLLVADRLTALGMMASGIAHELNNPLTYVLNALAELDPSLASEARQESLGLMRQGLERVRDIVRHVKRLADRDSGESGPVDLRESMDFALEMTRHVFEQARVRVEKRYASERSVKINEVRLGQILVNLLVHAGQSFQGASTREGGNTLQISIEDAGDAVSIEVRDNGPGLEPAAQARLFVPFSFSTARPGLGLAISDSLLKEAGGSLSVRSAPETGTTFTILLPSAWKPVPLPAPVPEKPSGEARRVLLVDNDGMVAMSLARLLRRTHEVTVALSGEEALQLLAGGSSFDVVLSDVTMPGLRGTDFVRLAQERHGAQVRRWALMSGAWDRREVNRAALTGTAFFEKPPDLAALRSFICQEEQ